MSDIKATVYEGCVAISPSDSTVYAKPFAALWVSAAGTLTITDMRGTKSALIVPIGLFPVTVIQVWASGTSATVAGLSTYPYPGPAAQ